MKNCTLNKPITSRGLVSEGEWDDAFNPIALKLETYKENDFLIKMDRMGKRLIKQCGKVVDIVGVTSTDKYGRRWISVKGFEKVEIDDREFLAE